MTAQTLYPAERGNLRLSFEYFPPKTDEMEAQLFQTADDLSVFGPAFITVIHHRHLRRRRLDQGAFADDGQAIDRGKRLCQYRRAPDLRRRAEGGGRCGD
jgi:hypothetical protein